MFSTWLKGAKRTRESSAKKEKQRRRSTPARRFLFLESLEERVVFSSTPLAQAYGFDDIFFPTSGGGLIAGDGSGQTIAVVIVGQQPNLVADLHAFSQAYG
ncbi:MAG: hypothetical protein ABUL64_01885, partial [Singulisphaera sp.]